MAMVRCLKAGLDDVLRGTCLAPRASLAREGLLPTCRHSHAQKNCLQGMEDHYDPPSLSGSPYTERNAARKST